MLKFLSNILPPNYFKTAFRWQKGRQESGYDKMLLLSALAPISFDSYLIRYPVGSFIAPHIDPVSEKRHFRLNIVLKKSQEGGDFICQNPIFATERIKFFRPDISEHSVTKVNGSPRYIFSVGWVLP